jgi:hypothetical protein
MQRTQKIIYMQFLNVFSVISACVVASGEREWLNGQATKGTYFLCGQWNRLVIRQDLVLSSISSLLPFPYQLFDVLTKSHIRDEIKRRLNL